MLVTAIAPERPHFGMIELSQLPFTFAYADKAP